MYFVNSNSIFEVKIYFLLEWKGIHLKIYPLRLDNPEIAFKIFDKIELDAKDMGCFRENVF